MRICDSISNLLGCYYLPRRNYPSTICHVNLAWRSLLEVSDHMSQPECKSSLGPPAGNDRLRDFLFTAGSFRSAGLLRRRVRVVRPGGLLSYAVRSWFRSTGASRFALRSEEHTSELQSR